MWLLSNKVLVRDSGLLDDFRDCHCHLLPGVDDGVKDLQHTLQILDIWESLGVKEIWMTPHVMEEYPNEKAALQEKYEEVKANYGGEIKLHVAAEYMMDGLFTKRLEHEGLMTLGTSGKRLLVETSYFIPPINMEEIIEQVKKKGYEPVLAHPERYRYMDLKDYVLWKQKGVRLQLNVPSLVGAYGPEVQRKAEWMLEREMYDYCGTDTHSMNYVEYFLNSRISKKVVRKVQRVLAGQEL